MSSKYSFKFTPLAEEDIGSALVYISQKLFNVKAADDLFAKIENAIAHICEFPYSFADCSYFLINDLNIRHANIDNYVLVYEVLEDAKQINVLRFVYAKMDLSRLNIKD